jgi:ATP-dependent DNA helicase DinG
VSRIARAVQDDLAREIAAAGGREVSFVATVDAEGRITAARAVARGTVAAVLALPGVADRGEMLLHNHPSGVLEPSHADLDVAARLHDAGIGFGIIDNTCQDLYVVVEVPKATAYVPLDAVGVAALLDKGGAIAQQLGQFEDRPSQRDMTSYVADTYNEGGISLIEAGTGVGKSFAYLTPAILWARANRERTIVSTNTINLQEQLVGKDLPVLAKALEDKDGQPTFAMLKGWRNYLCLSRLDLARGSQGSLLEADRQAELNALAKWAKTTRDGSLADMPDDPSSEVWDEVAAEADLCTRLRCPHFDQCFVFAARRRAAEADVVVVNHHLLTSDVEIRRVQSNWQDAAVLPPYKRLIIDEAHHLEDTAASHLGAQVTSTGVMRLLARLERSGKGLIPTLIAELTDRDDLLSTASVDLLRKDLLPAVVEARAFAVKVFGALGDVLVGKEQPVMRLEDSFAQHDIWSQGLGVNLDNLINSLNRLRGGVETVVDRLELDEESDRRSQLVQELRAAVRRLQATADGMLLTLRPQQGAATVRWIERRGNKPVGELSFPVGLSAVPLDLAPILKESLFDRVDTVVLTSATLATGGDFQFLKDRLGLSLPPSRERFAAALPSPFDFASQCLFGVPTDFPEPRGDEAGHDQAMAKAVLELAHASDGGMFVLFTSHAQLRRVAGLVRPGVGSRWPLLIQGEGQRDKLLQRFREAGSAILFGTDSFWEGVDVPGQALRALVIAKLPFRVPTEPLTAARLERLAEQGEDGFRSYLLPLAALKLKQGFGRLIRSKTDMGVVVLMDPRAATRNYGDMLLASLPRAARVIGPWAEVRSAAEEFFARHGVGAPA